MNKNDIILECLDKFTDVFPDVPIPKIEWNARMRSTAGRVRGNRRLKTVEFIQLNPHLLTDREKLVRTFMHELAHVAEITLYGNGGHGNTWKHCMIKLGREPERCHSYDVGQLRRRHNRVKAKCGCDAITEVTTKRATLMRKGNRYRCVKCSTTIELV